MDTLTLTTDAYLSPALTQTILDAVFKSSDLNSTLNSLKLDLLNKKICKNINLQNKTLVLEKYPRIQLKSGSQFSSDNVELFIKSTINNLNGNGEFLQFQANYSTLDTLNLLALISTPIHSNSNLDLSIQRKHSPLNYFKDYLSSTNKLALSYSTNNSILKLATSHISNHSPTSFNLNCGDFLKSYISFKSTFSYPSISLTSSTSLSKQSENIYLKSFQTIKKQVNIKQLDSIVNIQYRFGGILPIIGTPFPNDLFRHGGPLSIRGTAFNSLGPLTNNIPSGGRLIHEFGISIKKSVFNSLNVFCFLNAGKCADSLDLITDLNVTSGFGVAVDFGNVEVEVGYVFNHCVEGVQKDGLIFGVGVDFL